MPVLDLDAVRANFEAFPGGFETLLMATTGADGAPHASYAPYLRDGVDFYVYVSQLAAHTRNLHEQGRVCVFFVEDESEASSPFARRRATFYCTAQEVPRDSDGFAPVMDALAGKFGALVEKTLRHLTDFRLYRLTPHKAAYVAGFGRAFVIEGEDLDQLRHRSEAGHRDSRKSAP